MLSEHDALLVVGLQVDLFPGGALAVAGADTIVPVVNRYLRLFDEQGLRILVSRDWHPADHCSFVSQGGPWPEHCVQGTAGAELQAGLQLPPIFTMVHRGTASDREAHSDFEGTGLARVLEGWGIRRIFVCGLALEYGVRATCIDGARAGFDVLLLRDGCRAVNLLPGDDERALAEIVGAGVQLFDGVPE